MGKRGGKSKDNNNGGTTSTSSSGFHTSLSIREEASGKKQSHNPKSLLKLNHLQNLANWASGESSQVAQLGSLGAFFGHSFAEFAESLGVPPDSSLFSCQRCETILQPGCNCTVRIEKIRAKRRRNGKLKIPAQNNVVYTCLFCSHRNIKRGTLKGHMKAVAPSRINSSKHEIGSCAAQRGSMMETKDASSVALEKASAAPSPALSSVTAYEANAAPSRAVSNAVGSVTDNPAKSVGETGAKLLDSKRRKRNKSKPKNSTDETSASSTPAQIEKAGSTSKRRKTWTTLKEIAENEQRERNKRLSNISIPFVL